MQLQTHESAHTKTHTQKCTHRIDGTNAINRCKNGILKQQVYTNKLRKYTQTNVHSQVLAQTPLAPALGPRPYSLSPLSRSETKILVAHSWPPQLGALVATLAPRERRPGPFSSSDPHTPSSHTPASTTPLLNTHTLSAHTLGALPSTEHTCAASPAPNEGTNLHTQPARRECKQRFHSRWCPPPQPYDPLTTVPIG